MDTYIQAAGVQAPTSITSYSNHAVAQIAGRDGGIGVSQAAVNDAFANPVAIQYVPSTYAPTFRSPRPGTNPASQFAEYLSRNGVNFVGKEVA